MDLAPVRWRTRSVSRPCRHREIRSRRRERALGEADIVDLSAEFPCLRMVQKGRHRAGGGGSGFSAVEQHPTRLVGRSGRRAILVEHELRTVIDEDDAVGSEHCGRAGFDENRVEATRAGQQDRPQGPPPRDPVVLP